MEDFAEVPNNLDAWIETLFTCKPLKENDIKSLCEQVHQNQMISPCHSMNGENDRRYIFHILCIACEDEFFLTPIDNNSFYQTKIAAKASRHVNFPL